MATVRDDSIAASIWQNMKVQCPICKKTFSNWYCPNCGLPKNNSSYGIYEDKIYYCGSNHFRREFGIVNEFQLCSKCLTPNPYNANYCRNCGEDITLHAKDKNGHGWIDLGLSVLWSTNSIDGYFQWNNTKYFGKDEGTFHLLIDEYKKAEKKDVATYMWGKKWRTPTKAEFEELIEKCKWEKILIPNTTERALKITGPNNNFIYFLIARTIHLYQSWDKKKGKDKTFSSVSYWTATKATDEKAYFYRFVNSDDGLINCDSELNLSWLSTSYTPEGHHFRMGYNHSLRIIRPVADKKWLGEL